MSRGKARDERKSRERPDPTRPDPTQTQTQTQAQAQTQAEATMLSVQAPQWTFGNKPAKNSSAARDGPGPADYAPTVPSKASSYSLTGRNFVKESSQNAPGPGAYAVKNSIHNHKGPAPSSFSMGKRLPQTGKFTPNPGPADYSQNTPFRSATGAPRFSPDKHSRGGAHGEGFEDLQSPGPGSYAVHSSEKSGPKYSIRSRLSEKARPSNSPGPAAYSVRGPAASGPKFSMGSSKRFVRTTSETDSTPGPGEYVVGKSRGPAFTIQSRVSSTSKLDSTGNEPGPCSYSPNFTTKKAAPAFSLGGKQSNPELKGNKVPGPGHYALHKRQVGKQGSTKSSSFTIGARTKIKSSSTTMTPGPAAYKPGKDGREVPAFTMRPRHNNTKSYSGSSPGPSEYSPNINNLTKSPYYSFGMKLKK